MSRQKAIVEFEGTGDELGRKAKKAIDKEQQEASEKESAAYLAATRPSYLRAKTAVEGETVLTTPNDIARRLRYLKDLKDNIEAGSKEVNKEIDEASQALAELMESMGLDGLKVADVGTVYIEAKNRPTIKDQDEFYAYLRSHNGEGMIKETVHPQTLAAWVKEELENARSLPPSISNFIQKRAVIRRK